MSPIAIYWHDGSTVRCIHGSGSSFTPDPDAPFWTDPHSPADQWASEADFTAPWSGVLSQWAGLDPWATADVRDLTGYTSDFRAACIAMCNAASNPIVIRLPEELLHLTSFVVPTGVQTFAFGMYHPNFRGWLGRGPGRTIVQQDAGSVSAAQITALEALTSSQTNALAMCLAQPGTGSTWSVLMSGLTMQAADQPTISSVNFTTSSSPNPVMPQPAPHSGIMLGPNRDFFGSHLELLGCGYAINPSPPFEQTNLGSQYGKIRMHHVLSDGRRAASIDPARPWSCNPYMGNNEDLCEVAYTRFCHAPISRVAINDQNSGNTETSAGAYTFGPGYQVDHIGNHNVKPHLNGGASLGAYSGAVAHGFESVGGPLTFHAPHMSVDNPWTDNAISQHIGLNFVSGVNRQGGRLRIYGGTFRNTAFPWLDGWLCIRISQSSYWYTDGVANTIFVYAGADDSTLRKQPWLYTGAWTQAAMTAAATAAGVSPATHYLLRNTVS